MAENREYQAKHIEELVEKVSTKRKVVGQLPTGGGKTVEFAMIAHRYTQVTNKSVLILVNRDILMYQAEKTVKDITGIKPYLITAGTNRYAVARIYIGMVGSTVSRLNCFDNVGLVIVDECHINEFNKIHSIFLEELIIGFSATPISSSLREPVNKYYNDIVTGPQIKELIAMGYLSQDVTRVPSHMVDSSKFQLDKLKGDYNERQMYEEYKSPLHVTNVIDQYFKYCIDEKTIVFCVNIEHSKEVAKCFQTCGYNARHFDSTTRDEDRIEILKWFRETKDAILVNVMMTTFGFDEPTVKNIILNFSTLSLVKLLQCGGRGGRIIDQHFIDKYQHLYPYKLELKNTFNIIDIGGNYARFGGWSDDRDWKYIFYNPPRPGDGLAPVKRCPECEGLLHAAVRVCTLRKEDGELCLHYFEPKRTAEELMKEEMKVVGQGIDIDELREKNKKKFELYTFLDLANEVVRTMFRTYKEPNETILQRYFKIYYSLCCEWWKKEMFGREDRIEDISDSGYYIIRARNNFNEKVKTIKKDAEILNTNLVYELMN